MSIHYVEPLSLQPTPGEQRAFLQSLAYSMPDLEDDEKEKERNFEKVDWNASPGMSGETKRLRSLWGAVLQQAITDLQVRVYKTPSQRNTENMRIREDARKWFTDDYNHIGSFRFVCDVLDLNPDYLLKRLINGLVHIKYPLRARLADKRTLGKNRSVK